MSFGKNCILSIAVISMALTSVSAIADPIQYLGTDGHLPAVVCGRAVGVTANVKKSLESLSVSLEQLKKDLNLRDSDIKISDFTHVESRSLGISVGNCVLVSPYTERAVQAATKEATREAKE